MQNPAGDLLQYLDTEEKMLKSIARDAAGCETPRGAEAIIANIQEKLATYEVDVRAEQNLAFCRFFLAYAYYFLGDYQQASDQADNAISLFGNRDQGRNRALALWLRALINLKTGHDSQAEMDFQDAIMILQQKSSEYQRTGNYKDFDNHQKIIKRIKQDSIPTRDHPPAREKAEKRTGSVENRSQSYSNSSSFAQRNSKIKPQGLVYPIYDPVQAGKGGKFIFDSLPEGQASISEILIDDKPFHIFSIRENESVILQPRIYRWLYITGDSMNQASPVPLLEGDCALVMETESSGFIPSENEIVVAALVDPSGISDRAGVIKKYTREGLCSESSKSYPKIPLRKARVRGIVVAVAKPA